jgi:hypothetical protein
VEAAAKVLAPIFYKKNSKKPPQSLKKPPQTRDGKKFQMYEFPAISMPR